MNRLLTLAALLLIVGVLNAQPPALDRVGVFESSAFRDDPKSISIDNIGNVITTGQINAPGDFNPGPMVYNLTPDPLEGGNIYLEKMDRFGGLMWAYEFGGVGHPTDEKGLAVGIDDNNNVYLLGTFTGTVDFNPGTGNEERTSPGTSLFLLSLTPAGAFRWVNTWIDAEFEPMGGLDIDLNGNIIITGKWRGVQNFNVRASSDEFQSVAGEWDIFIMKHNSDGDYIWGTSLGVQNFEGGSAIITDESDNIYVTGEFRDAMDFDPGAGDETLNGGGGTNGFILKLDAAGVFIWVRELSASAGELFAADIKVTSAQQVVVIGKFAGTVDFDVSAAGTDDVTSQSGAGYDGFWMQLDANGNNVWYNTIMNANPSSLVINNLDEVHTTGSFGPTVDFDPGTGDATRNSAGSADYFLNKFTPSGGFEWVITSGNTGYDAGSAMAMVSDGRLVVTGSFEKTIDFDPGACEYNVSAGASSGIFIQKFLLDPAPSTCITVTQQPTNHTVCSGDVVILETQATGHPAITYIWQTFDNDGNEIDLIDNAIYSGTTTNKLTINTAGGLGEGYYRCKLSAPGSPDVYTTDVLVYVGPHAPAIDNVVLCGPGSGKLLAADGLPGQYRWYTVPTGGTAIPGETNFSYTTPSLTVTTTFYVAIHNGTCEGPRSAATVHITACEPGPGLVWAKGIGGNHIEAASAVAVDSDGSIVVVGNFAETVDFDQGPGVTSFTAVGYDGYIMKMTPNGDLIWAKALTGTGNAFLTELSIDGSGNIYVGGTITGATDFDPDATGSTVITSAPANRYDVFISKYDGNGLFSWAKKIGGGNHDDIGGLEVDAAGNVFATGHFIGTAAFDTNMTSSGTADIWVVRLNTSGGYVWKKQIGGPHADVGDTAHDLVIDGSSIVITGSIAEGTNVDFDPNAGTFPITVTPGAEAYVLRLDLNGSFLNAFTFPKTDPNGGGNGLVINVDDSGNIYAMGNQVGKVDYDPSTSVFEMVADENYVSTYVVKLSSTGSLIWAKQFRSNFGGYIFAASLNFADNGDIITSGIYGIQVDFDPGPLEYKLSSNALSQNTFLTKLNSDGEFNWAISLRRIQNVTSSVHGGISMIHPNGNIYAFGSFQGSVDFDPNECSQELNSVNLQDIYIQRLSYSAANICINLEPTDTQSCGATATFVALAEGTDGITYQWQKKNTTTSVFENITDDANYSGTTTTTLTVNTAGAFGAGEYRTVASAVNATSKTSAVAVLTLGGTPPNPPGVVPASSCTPASITLTATGSTPGNYRWYSSSTSTAVLSSDEVLLTPVLFSTTTYYVSINSGACESTRVAVVATIGGLTPPTTTGASTCNSTGSLTLTAAGGAAGEYRWYTTATGGSAISGETNATYTTPVLTTSTTYYVSIMQASCESPRSAVVATVNAGSAPPTVTGQSRCGAGTVTLSASGGTSGQYRWYFAATGGTAITGETNSSYTTASISVTTSYFVSINYGSCESSRIEVVATVTSPGAAPAASGTTVCTNATATLTATGTGTILWYDVATGGTSVHSGATFTTPALALTTTYHVASSNGTCETPRTPVVVTVSNCANNQPPAIAPATGTTGIGGSVTIVLMPLLSDPDNNIDLATLKIKVQPKSGAIASIDQNGQLSVDYTGVTFTGSDEITIEVCDIAGSCTTRIITIVVSGEVFTYNAVSPNGDGKNEEFQIAGIDLIPATRENTVKIFNRWGDLVFETVNYNNTTNVFKGLSSNGKELPSGTYYYIISFSGRESMTGYLVVKR
jgi:gliding motility-associated-like protein